MALAIGRRARRRSLGLTTRGSCLLAAGLTAVVCGLIVGSLDLVRVGLLVAVLPFAAALIVHRSRVRIAEQRTADPAISHPGEQVVVNLRLTNQSRIPVSTAMLADRLPAETKRRARFVLDGLPGRTARELSYQVPPLPRGRYSVGPLEMRLTDPFHLVDTSRSLTSVAGFVVTPVIERLGVGEPARSFDIGDNAGSHSVGAHGADDASTREYRTGDDLRKIHWRSTARTGSLMVRLEERPWQGQATLLLDARGCGHSSAAVASADPRESDSFEWAVSAVASIGAHLMRARRDVTLVDDQGDPNRHLMTNPQQLAQHLGPVRTTSRLDLGRQAGVLRSAGRDSALIAVLGKLDNESLRVLAAAHPRGSAVPALALLLDVDTWGDYRPPDSTAHYHLRESGSGGTGGAATSVRDAARVLRAGGWRVTVVERGDRIADAWQSLLRSAGVVAVGSSGTQPAAAPATLGPSHPAAGRHAVAPIWSGPA